MKSASVFAVVFLAAGFSVSGAAIQSAYAVDAASVTCADFSKMSAADQEAGFEAVRAAMPPATLTTTDSNSQKSPNTADGSKPAPSVGMLVSACQADPADTVMAAAMKAMTGPSAASSSSN